LFKNLHIGYHKYALGTDSVVEISTNVMTIRAESSLNVAILRDLLNVNATRAISKNVSFHIIYSDAEK
jgi:hypothetical protein